MIYRKKEIMNFIEAVTVYNNKECEKIRSIVSGRVFETNYYTRGISGGSSPTADEILGEWGLINHIPATEEVEVKVQIGIHPDGSMVLNPAQWCTDWPLGELTGHYSRPAKQKEKKRVEFSISGKHTPVCKTFIPNGAKYFAEWEE